MLNPGEVLVDLDSYECMGIEVDDKEKQVVLHLEDEIGTAKQIVMHFKTIDLVNTKIKEHFKGWQTFTW